MPWSVITEFSVSCNVITELLVSCNVITEFLVSCNVITECLLSCNVTAESWVSCNAMLAHNSRRQLWMLYNVRAEFGASCDLSRQFFMIMSCERIILDVTSARLSSSSGCHVRSAGSSGCCVMLPRIYNNNNGHFCGA